MTETTAQILRKPFAPSEIGKLPRVTCPACSDRRSQCAQHQKARCGECGSWVSTQHIHIDYVGHADVTSRLLLADPEWKWEPGARDVDPAALAAAVATGNPEVIRMVIENSPPKYDLDDHGNPVGLWIKLTVGGVTRPGYGSVPSSQGDPVKVLIGDALRNAAMRFGVALDLWAKGDRADPTAENATASAGQAQRRPQSAGEAFENARPARQGNGRRSINAEDIPPPDDAVRGTVARPAAAPRPPAATGEPDPDAQPYADEAHEARTVTALRPIHIRAREAHKLAALIRNPGTGGIGGLGAYMNWKKTVLEKAEAALATLEAAGKAAGLSRAELDAEVLRQAGKSIEDATAEDMEKVTAVLSALVTA